MRERELFLAEDLHDIKTPLLLMEQLFLLFSFLILLTGLMVITSLNPIHSTFWLTLTFILSACLFITINIDFIALIMIIIYVGAIAILFLFVIMMIDTLRFDEFFPINHLLPITVTVSLPLFFNLWWLNKNQLSFLFNESTYNQWEINHLINILTIGKLIYLDYSLIFIIASFILLLAMVGTIILTHDLSYEVKRQNLTYQHQRNNSWI